MNLVRNHVSSLPADLLSNDFGLLVGHIPGNGGDVQGQEAHLRLVRHAHGRGGSADWVHIGSLFCQCVVGILIQWNESA